ncbi:PREDICTED: phytosulfokines 3 [Camelina sativa]|uniref:Phytosulfokine n=1 Tax=Camelina sativa TaxID=90675 RepID=A0ABM0ZGB0_CAMSA|nr:PREDICTED: phytosulfokines 3 [Camelina sativa]
MAKFTTIFIIALLLCSTLTYAARLTPTATTASSRENSVKEIEGDMVEEESCNGIGEEECLIRRSLVVHTDYIYTQNHKP